MTNLKKKKITNNTYFRQKNYEIIQIFHLSFIVLVTLFEST